MLDNAIEAFVRESNAIEGILRAPTPDEILAHIAILDLFEINLAAICEFQAIVAPGKPLRSEPGMNVRVGNQSKPPGGPDIRRRLGDLLDDANRDLLTPWRCHVRFELLHPFLDGNGRTGRVLWAWQMQRIGQNPFAVPFLHRFYYQTLDHMASNRAG